MAIVYAIIGELRAINPDFCAIKMGNRAIINFY